MSGKTIHLRIYGLAVLMLCSFALVSSTRGQGTLPIVAIHDSELTRALASMPATGSTPTGPGTTGYQWWPTNWPYYVMPDSVKDMLSSDGTTFAVVGDSNILAGVLTNVDGSPKYPIVISLASEAINDAEIAQLTNYVASGGFLFLGSSSFTRNPDGSSRTNFALANAMGLDMVNPGLTNWLGDLTFTKLTNHTVVADIPSGTVFWQMPSSADETTVPEADALTQVTPNETPPNDLPHSVWQVRASTATVLAQGDSSPYILVQKFGRGYFIYDAAMQPFLGHGGWAPTTYCYSMLRNTIQWAFQSVNRPVVKLSPWPYPYQAALLFRHDMEAIPSLINSIESSAQFEYQNGAKGEYYFCTGCLREDYSPSLKTNEIASLQRAISLYGAAISSHNGGLTNINTFVPPLDIIELIFGLDPNWYTSVNPYGYDVGFLATDYDYWHWGPDEVLDVTNLPPGFSSGRQYAFTSISNSFNDLDGWGLTNGNFRIWASPNFNSTRDPSHQILQQLGVKTTGDEKICPFPGLVLSTQTPDSYYPIITIPTSDRFVGNQIAQSVETEQTILTIQNSVDYFYNLGGLLNFYAHSSSAANAGRAPAVESENVTYSMNSSLHPRLWAVNSEDLYNWWLQRSNAQVTTTSFVTNGIESQVIINVSGAVNTNTSVEIVTPGAYYMVGQVLTNGVAASNSSYWIKGQTIKLLVGNTVTNAIINYTLIPSVQSIVYTAHEGVPLSVAALGVLTNAATGAAGGNLTAMLANGPANGSLTLNSDGSFIYTPSNNFVGIDCFTYQATSGSQTSAVATATIIVNPPTDLFYDNFARSLNDSNSLSPWIVDAGTWTITNGLMTGTCDAGPGGYGGLYISNSTWTDYVAQAQIQFSSVNGWAAGLGGRLNPATGAHYVAWVYPDGSGGGANTLQLYKFTSWTDSGDLLAQQSLPSVGTGWHTLALGFQGTNIVVYFDNALEISTNDPDSALPSGGIIVDTVAGYTPYSINISNVVVTTLPVTANNDSYSGAENGILTVTAPGVLLNDIGVNLSAMEISPPANGSLTLNTNGSFTYIPNANFIGTDSFTYEDTNGQTNSNIAMVTLNITPFLANNDSYSLVENTTLSVPAPGVLGNDSSGGASLTAVLVTGPANGVLTLNSDGSFTFTPNNGYIGADSFTYEANNGQTNSNIATVNLIVTSDPPTANADFYTVTSNATLTVSAPGVLGNDIGGGPLSAILVSGSADGALALKSDGSFTYTPNSGFVGIDSFNYVATDGVTTSAVATVSIDVAPSGDLFFDDFTRSLNNSNSLLPWIYEDGTWTLTNSQLQGIGDGLPNYYGNVYIDTNWTDYTIQAQIQFSSTTMWAAGVGGRLDAATGAHYAAWVFPEESQGPNYPPTVGATGTAVLKLMKYQVWQANDSQYSVIQQVNLPSVGTAVHTVALAMQGTNINVYFDGVLQISTNDPDPYISGGITLDTASYLAPGVYSSFYNVTVTAPAVVANADSYSVAQNTTLTVAAPGVLANDEGAGLSAIEVSGPTNGLLTLNSDGSFTYTPDSDYIGSDSFTYQASNGQTNSNIATVTINVTNVISNPVIAGNDYYSVTENAPLIVGVPGVLANDSGGSGALAAILVSSPANGLLTLNTNGSFIYTPATNFTGIDGFSYVATDGTLTSSVAVVTIDVTPTGALFFDDFTRPAGNAASLFPWVYQDGTWDITNDVMQGTGDGLPGYYGHVYIDTNWTNYSIQAQFQFTTTNTWAGGVGGRLDATTGAHYAAWVFPEGSFGPDWPSSYGQTGIPVLKLMKFEVWQADTPQYSIIQQVNLPPVGTDVHTVTLSMLGTNINVYFDGVLQISTNDPDPYTGGGITLDTAGYPTPEIVNFDNVTVNSSLLEQTVDFDPLPNKTYGDAPFTISGTATSGLPVSFSIASGPATIVGNIITITGAGLVTVQASQAGNASYQPAPNVYQSFTVLPASVTVASGLSANNKAYDGTATASLSSNNVVLGGVLALDAGKVGLSTNGYVANFTNANVGVGIGVTVGGLGLAGSAAGNYNLGAPTNLAANITALGLTVASGLSANNKAYDGTATASLSSNNVVLGGVLALDAGKVGLSTNGYVANFTNANVGVGIGVTVGGLGLAGSAAGNYNLGAPTNLAANITALGLTVASGLSANNKAYDGTATASLSSNNVVLGGVLALDAGKVGLSTNGYVANFTNANVGVGIGVTVGGLGLAGSAAGNYNLGAPTNLAANITALGLTVASGLSANNKAYDGTATASLSSNNVVLGGVLALDAGKVGLSTNGYVANFTNANVGVGIGVTVGGLGLAGSAAGNYNLGAPTNLAANITALGLTVASGLSANNKAYDGTATASLSSNNVVLGGVLALDAGKVGLSTNGYVANFTNANVGVGIGVTVGGLGLAGSAAGNYNLGAPTNLAANITALGLTVASGLSANNKAYDGTATASLSSNNVVLGGVLALDAGKVGLSTNGYVANFTNANVGVGIGVTVGGLGLAGSAAGNYNLGAPTNLAANITALGLTVASGLSANNKAYDGTATASLSSNNVVLGGVLALDAGKVGLSTNGYVANFTNANVGVGIGVTVGGLGLAGSAAGNYNLGAPTNLAANITALGLTVASGLSANNKAYDGTATASLSSNNVVLGGVLALDAGKVGLSTNGYVANFTNANVGVGIGVTVGGLGLAGSAAGNYNLGAPTNLAANITALGLTVASGLSANNKAYDGTATASLSSNNVVLGGVLALDAGKVGLSTNGYVANFTNANVGVGIGVTVGGLGLAGSAAGNYNLGAPTNLAANITALGLTVASGLSANNKAYDGTATASLSSNNVVLGGVLALDAGKVGLSTNGYVANFTNANVGVGIGVTVGGLGLAGSAAGNYNLGAPTNLAANITALGLTVASGLSANNKAYDGTATASLSSNNVVLGGVLALDAGKVGLSTNGYVANFTNANVGVGIGVTVGGLGLAGSAAGNYNLGAPTNLAANITALGLTVASGLSANNKAYDGTATASLSSNNVVLGGVLALDAGKVGLSTNGYVANFTNANVGVGIGVTVGGLGLAGSAAGNYNLGAPTNLAANITALGLTVASGLSANNKAYDGTATASLSSNNVVLGGVLALDAGKVGLSTNGYVANFTNANVGVGIGVTVGGLGLAGSAAGNYNLGAPTNLAANITALGLTVLSVPSPTISSIVSSNGVVTITWNSVIGGVYRVQSIDSLNGANWNDLVPDVTATGITASQTNLVTGVAQRFYRIMVLNPGITANNKVYDGTTTATISSNNVVLLGVVNGDMVSLSTNDYAANFASAGAGNNIAVTVSGLGLSGPSSANYTLVQPTELTANITPATLTVSAVNASTTYGLSPALNVIYSGFVNGEGTNVLTGNPDVTTTATNNSPLGTYPITVGNGTLNAVNYVFNFLGGTITIAGAPQINAVALSGNQIVISYPTLVNQNYQLQFTTNLAPATWIPLYVPVTGTGGSIFFSNSLPVSSQGFFRLLISP